MDQLKSTRKALEEPLLHFQNVDLSLLLLLQIALVLVGTLVFSRLFTRFLKRRVLSRAHISVGIQESIARVLHYCIMIVGALVAMQLAGINLTALTALGAVFMVGIGFGLQNLANNMVSGVILLFERPVQVGDFVEVKGALGTVREIRARSTTVETQDNISIVVPNSYFVSESVTNWSHRDPHTRIHVRVHVSFDSDVEAVRDILLQVASEHPEVLATPPPRVQFQEFSDWSLKFDLLPWIKDPTRQFFVRSDLNFAIVRAFRERGIQIPVPQRDVFLRSPHAPDENSATDQ